MTYTYSYVVKHKRFICTQTLHFIRALTPTHAILTFPSTCMSNVKQLALQLKDKDAPSNAPRSHNMLHIATFLKHTMITHEMVRKYRYHKNCTVTSLPQITTLLQKHSASRQSHSYTQALHFAIMFICLPAIGPRQIDNYRYGHTSRKKGERNRFIHHRTAVILL